MTAGSIIVFSNGDRKMPANEEATFSLLGRVYRAMTEEMTPASNVEEMLLRFFLFFPCCCTTASFVQSTSIRSTNSDFTQYKTWTADCGLRTTDYGLGIKYGLRYKTRTQV